jgi:hypothetical protein
MNTSEVVYRFNRLDTIDQWWKWAVVVLVVLALASYFWIWYRKDTQELSKPLGWGLLILRLTALAGIVFFFFQLQKRTDERVVRPSRVALLVDTSLSMTLPAQLPDSSQPVPLSRIEKLLNEFENGNLLPNLMKQHEVVVYRFDATSRPVQIAQFLRDNVDSTTAQKIQVDQNAVSAARTFAWISLSLLSIALLAFLFGLIGRSRRSNSDSIGYAYLVTIVTAVSAMVFIGIALVRVPELPLAELFNTTAWTPPTEVSADEGNKPINPRQEMLNRLIADGPETRLGDALKALLELERGSALTSVIVFTDGRSNSGLDPSAAASLAKGMSITVHAVGLGSEKNPPNVRLIDLEAPKRVYPGDSFSISAVIQATGVAKETAIARLRRRSAASSNAPWISEDEKPVSLPEDDQYASISFDIKPSDVGRWLYEVSLLPPKSDSNEKDNQQTREVQIVERKNRVLIVSSGPTREYQFVRNLLYRDKDIETGVWLQSGRPGMSQEGTTILDSFPTTQDELLKYDAIVAFDADWLALKLEQIQLLERWVSEQAGGLILIAGPVATPKWSGFSGKNDSVTLLRGLSPVELDARGTRLISSGRFDADKAWNLSFADGAMQNDFLWLDNDPEVSLDAWKQFPGIYSYFATYEAKPGARVIATFSDPTSGRNGLQPVYMAAHFYGAGRVFFQGSGEIWRVRELSDSYFDTYYTKLIRWVSQGRLLRDSDRGILLFDKEETVVGEQVAVRAVLKDEKLQPLMESEVKTNLRDPSGRLTPITLRPLQDAGQPGVYVGQFVCGSEGLFEMELTLGSLGKQEILNQQVLAKVPAREIQLPQRNDPLLAELTLRAGGKYFPTLEEALVSDASGVPALVAASPTQDQVNKVLGTPDQKFQLRLMGALMALIGGVLSLEWLIRRLNKLA